MLPRIVVVVDEFHELFEEADTIGLEAFAAFSDIVRMGPFSGVHIVVASQTLSSMPAMDRQTLILLPQRVAFMCNEYDAEIVMGDTNKAARMLSKTGEGLFNPARGDESKNQPFQGLYVAPEQRGGLLRALRQKADASVGRAILGCSTVMPSSLGHSTRRYSSLVLASPCRSASHSRWPTTKRLACPNARRKPSACRRP